MRNRIKIFLAVSFFLTISTDVFAESSLSPGMRLWFSGPDISVLNMPLEARDIPIHPDDDYASSSNAGPIEKTDYDINGTFSLGFFREWKCKKLKLGFGLDWIYVWADDKGRNYTNAVGTGTRGYGAALTYVRLTKSGIIPKTDTDWLDVVLNLTPQAFAEIPFGKSFSLGSSVSYFCLQAESGWDRYDSLEVWKRHDLGQYLPVTAYLKFSEYFLVGASYPVELSVTDLGEKAEIESNVTFFVGVQYSF